ncbi:O-antigen ligase family protein [Cellulophaga baltica]|uniref:O-antigen ligase family protein n=1 Tax=Cellulophaga baltica TaxID=76594 RepID=UPI0037CBAA4F
MKKLSVNKLLLTILLLSIPFNFIAINGIGNVYISTFIIFIQSLLLIVLIRDKLINNKNVIIAIFVYLLLFSTTAINIILDNRELLKSQIVNSIIYLQNFLVFIIIYHLLQKKDYSYFFRLFLFIMIVASIRIAIEEPDKILKFSEVRGERIEALFIGGVNNYALLLAIAFIISFFKIKNTYIRLMSAFFWLLLISLTMSRGALLGAVLTIFIVAYYDRERKTLKSLIRMSIGLTLVGLLSLIYLNKLDLVVTQFNDRFLSLFTGGTSISKFSAGRGIIWSDILSKIKTSSIYENILGHGFGSIDFTVTGAPYQSSHNIFIDIFYKNGYLVFSGYIFLLIKLLDYFLKNRTKENLTIFGIFIFLHLELFVNPFFFAAQIGWIYSIFLVIFLKQKSYS